MELRVWASLALLLLAFPACRRKVEPVAPLARSEGLVARVGEVEIRAEQLAALISGQPAEVRQNLASAARKRALLENEVRLELLAAEALRRGYDRDPAFQHAVKQQLASILLQKEPGQKVEELLARLRTRTRVEIFESELTKVRVDPAPAPVSAPAAP
jgi:hypothetical protein